MKKFLSLFLCISLLITALSGCSVTNTNSSSSQDPSAVSSQALQATNKDSSIAFEELCNDIFLRMITSDTITLNFNVAYPENFGIEKQTPTLGEYTISNMYEDLAYYENKLQTLFAINKESLSENDKLTYDILIETIECYQKTGSFVLYSEPLSPTTGIQAQLPVLLAEFHFYNTSTIEDYLAMLECVPKYFSQILEYEKAKKEKGMFMSGEQADEIIKQCKDFIENPDENYLIEIFEDNIGDIDELSEEQFTQYAERNASLIKECLIPAYQSIIDGITGLKDDSVQTQGLCSLPDGKEYYASLVHFLTNSSRSQ